MTTGRLIHRRDRPSCMAGADAKRRSAVAALTSVYARELRAYFYTPLAYVFIAVFLLALSPHLPLKSDAFSTLTGRICRCFSCSTPGCF